MIRLEFYKIVFYFLREGNFFHSFTCLDKKANLGLFGLEFYECNPAA